MMVNDSCREDSGGGGGGHHHYTSSRGDPIQVVDLDHDAEISITGKLNVLTHVCGITGRASARRWGR